jgi:hypothetical protein
LPLNFTKVPTGAETTETLATCLSLLCDKVIIIVLRISGSAKLFVDANSV